MARVGSSTVVGGLTASALAVVTLLALQAKSSAHETTPSAGKPGATASATAGASAHPGGGTAKPVAVPAHSGSGRRVVYALGAKRVWLVDPAKPATNRTFTVMPSPVSPAAGSYTVTSALAGPRLGSDGVNIKNVVVFAHDGAVIGFSSAVDGTMPSPDGSKKTGGIRETLGDGQALFDFAPQGTKVVVVP